MTSPFDTPLNHTSDPEAERRILGGMIAASSVREAAKKAYGHLSVPVHDVIFIKIHAMELNDEPVNVLALASRLTRSSQLAEIGGIEYLEGLAAVAETNPDTIRDLVQHVRLRSIRRRISSTAIRLADLPYTDEQDIDQLVTQAKAEVEALALHAEHGDHADLDGLSKFTYSRGTDPITWAERITAIAIDAHRDVSEGRRANPATFPSYGQDLSHEALARKIVGGLMDAGWKPPSVGTAAIDKPEE